MSAFAIGAAAWLKSAGRLKSDHQQDIERAHRNTIGCPFCSERIARTAFEFHLFIAHKGQA